MITEKEITEKLSEIIDPELDRDIVSLGFVKGIEINDAKIKIKLSLTIPNCPLRFYFYEEIKQKIQKIKGVKEVEVEL